MKLAVFLPNWVGDVAMATPTLRALREHLGPSAKLLGVIRPYLAEVLAGTRWIDEWIGFDPRSSDVSLRGRAVARRLRAERCDAALLLSNSWRSALVAFASRTPRRIGYARGGRGWLLTTRLPAPRQGWKFLPTPAVGYYLELAHAFGCPRPASARLELATTDADERAADAVWSASGWSRETRVVALNNSGAFGAAKLWPEAHFAALARDLADQGQRLLVLCGPQERDAAQRLLRAIARPGVASLADQPCSLGLTKACIRRSRLLITTDSGPRHFAAAFGVPAITLFGPTDPRWSETEHPESVSLQHAVPCGPCQQRVCPLGHHRCMTELLPARVLEAARGLLDATSRDSRRPAA